MGIRPHALTGSQSGANVGQVRLVERLGNETIVSLQLPSGAEWLVVLDGDHKPAIGSSLALQFDPASAIIFDSSGVARATIGFQKPQ
jgi:multiple sugar transport system ATP-binding protein